MIKGSFQQPEGEEITAGMLLLEVVQANDSGNVVYHFLCGDRTTFEVGLPAEMGEVQLVAFLDIAGDGPVGEDPRGRTAEPIQVGIETVEGVIVPLSVGGDLGDLSPLFPAEEMDSGGERPPHPDGPDEAGTGEPPPQGDPGEGAAPAAPPAPAPDGTPGGPPPSEPATDAGAPAAGADSQP